LQLVADSCAHGLLALAQQPLHDVKMCR